MAILRIKVLGFNKSVSGTCLRGLRQKSTLAPTTVSQSTLKAISSIPALTLIPVTARPNPSAAPRTSSSTARPLTSTTTARSTRPPTMPAPVTTTTTAATKPVFGDKSYKDAAVIDLNTTPSSPVTSPTTTSMMTTTNSSVSDRVSMESEEEGTTEGVFH